MYRVISFYKFTPLDNYAGMRAGLVEFCKTNNLRGTILLADEGINGTVSGSEDGIRQLVELLSQDPRLAGMDYKEATAVSLPFHRMKVRLKKEIVSMGVPGIDAANASGIRVEPGEWNTLLADPDVLVLDTRNRYESDIGTFRNATATDTQSFSDFPEYVAARLDPDRHRKIAMYCTGGIRCEKASAWLLQQGFQEVYQLAGGILNYLQKTDASESLWEGECFVFDGRVAVDEKLQPGGHRQCFACRKPVSPQEQKSEKYSQGISCPACFDELSEDRRIRLEQRQFQVELAARRNQRHIGWTPEPESGPGR